jgi:hypothetical protein
MPIEEREFSCFDHRIPVFVIFGNDNLPCGFEVNDSIVVDRVFSGVQAGNDIHIFIHEMLFVWFRGKYRGGGDGWRQEHETQTKPWDCQDDICLHDNLRVEASPLSIGADPTRVVVMS